MRSWSCLSKPAGFSGRGESRFYAERLLREMVGAESGCPDGAGHLCPLLIAGESAQHPSTFSSPWFLIMPGSLILKLKCFSALPVLPVSYSCSWERMNVNSLGHECMLSLFLQLVMKWIIVSKARLFMSPGAFVKYQHGLNPPRRVTLVVLCAGLHVLCMVWILKLQGTQHLGCNNLNFIKRSLTKEKLREHSVQPHLLQRRKLRLFHSFVHSFNIYVKNTEVEVNLILT